MLKFHWVAKFNSRPDIRQYDEDGKEHAFREVLDLHGDLKSFSLIHTEKDFTITIDMNTGLIYTNIQTPEPELLHKEKRNLRPIYFRRNQVTLGTGFVEIGRTIVYFLGYQYNDSLGNNHKRLLQIDGDGNFIVGAK